MGGCQNKRKQNTSNIKDHSNKVIERKENTDLSTLCDHLPRNLLFSNILRRSSFTSRSSSPATVVDKDINRFFFVSVILLRNNYFFGIEHPFSNK